jgi:hypothetical protein
MEIELKNPDIRKMKDMEKVLLNELVVSINKKLEGKDNFYAFRIVDSLQMIVDDNFNPVMYMTSKFKVD